MHNADSFDHNLHTRGRPLQGSYLPNPNGNSWANLIFWKMGCSFLPWLGQRRLRPEVGHLEGAIHRHEGQRHLKEKLVIGKGMEPVKHRLKKPALLLNRCVPMG